MDEAFGVECEAKAMTKYSQFATNELKRQREEEADQKYGITIERRNAANKKKKETHLRPIAQILALGREQLVCAYVKKRDGVCGGDVKVMIDGIWYCCTHGVGKSGLRNADEKARVYLAHAQAVDTYPEFNYPRALRERLVAYLENENDRLARLAQEEDEEAELEPDLDVDGEEGAGSAPPPSSPMGLSSAVSKMNLNKD